MKRIVLMASAACVFLAFTAPKATAACDDRYINTCDSRGAYHYKHKRASKPHKRHQKQARHSTLVVAVHGGAEVVAHPVGCPHIAFCGCGTAVHIFGAPIRALWLAKNWFKFPQAEPAPGMVAVRRHHVFAIERVIDKNHVLAYDPNGGRHLTWLHVRSLTGYSVRNPHTYAKL